MLPRCHAIYFLCDPSVLVLFENIFDAWQSIILADSLHAFSLFSASNTSNALFASPSDTL